VYKVTQNLAVVTSLDFFTPICDNPYHFGAIAAANALSDLYAMGAAPKFALNIVAFPSSRLPIQVLEQILLGASDKAREAGISIVGGHSIDDNEPKFGMAVTGFIHPDQILTNKTARPGDVLILTKPIGTGILSTAVKRHLLSEKDEEFLVATMSLLNKSAAEAMTAQEMRGAVSACTDVTGFGLLGHLKEMAEASRVDVEIFFNDVPIFPGTLEFVSSGVVPGGTKNNLAFVSDCGQVIWSQDISPIAKLILCDAQTNGGLLISVSQNKKDDLMRLLKKEGVNGSNIGHFTVPGVGRTTVKLHR